MTTSSSVELVSNEEEIERGVESVQFTEFGEANGGAIIPSNQPIVAGRRLRAFPRSSMPLAVQWFPSPSGPEWVAVITSGINLVIDGVDPAGPLDISADRMVIWTRGQRSQISVEMHHRQQIRRWNCIWKAMSFFGKGSV